VDEIFFAGVRPDYDVATDAVVGGDVRALADDADAGKEPVGRGVIRLLAVAVAEARIRANHDVFIHNDTIQDRAGADPRIVQHNGIPYQGFGRDVHARREHRMFDATADGAAVRDQALDDLTLQANFNGGALLALGVNDPARVVQVERRLWREQRQVRLPIRLNGADVHPVAVESIGTNAIVFLDHGWDDVFAEVQVW